MVKQKPKESYTSRAVRQMFPSLRTKQATDPDFRKALSLARRCYETYLKSQEIGVDAEEPSKKKFRASGGGRKSSAQEVRQAAFEWFIDVRGNLKGRLPRKAFRIKCQELYRRWVEAQDAPPETPLQFSDRWINSWMKEYRVSLNHPNKRFALNRQENNSHSRILEECMACKALLQA